MATAGATAFDEALRATVGYRVTSSEGDTGVVVRVPEAGYPPRPLVLVVRGGDTFRFMPLQRIDRVSPETRQVHVRAETVTPAPTSGLERCAVGSRGARRWPSGGCEATLERR